MQILQQSAAVTLKIGPFLDSTDGVTAETGLTISQADVRLSMNGGNYAQKTEASACTHDELGEYDCPIDATDTGTVGRLRLSVQEAGAAPVWHDYFVVPAEVYTLLTVGTHAELAAVPTFPASVLGMLTFIYELVKHTSTQTATTLSLKKDDGSTQLGSATVSDTGGTFTRGEIT